MVMKKKFDKKEMSILALEELLKDVGKVSFIENKRAVRTNSNSLEMHKTLQELSKDVNGNNDKLWKTLL